MKEFKYVIKDAIGLHARPAGLLAKEAAKYQSKVTLERGGKTADASKLFAIMGMAIKHGEEVTVKAEGADEAAAIDGLKAFFSTNL